VVNAVRAVGLTAIGAALALGAVGCQATAGSNGTVTGGRRGAGGDTGPVPVVVAKARERDVPIEVAEIGNVEAFSTISVRAQITGTLTEVNFKEGDFVKKDSVLFRLDARPYQAAVAQAEADELGR
jgi:multidrug efflux system membrane fusion protein